MKRLAAALLLLLLSPPGTAQAQSAIPLSDSTQASVLIGRLGAVLRTAYIFPDRVDPILDSLRAREGAGAYRALETPEALAEALTTDLIRASGDLHFSVGADPAWVDEYRARDERADELRREAQAAEERTNHGFTRAEVLEGNVGYLRFDYFADPEYAHETVAAAMRFVRNTDALIIDLRYNNGGVLEMAQLLASYLFSPAKDQLLFQYYYNGDGGRVERGQWVLPSVPGERMTGVPVVVLTGSTSFSSAEWFSFVLQKLGRATLVGQRTAGGAHPVDRRPVDDRFFVQVPFGEIRDPVDGTDFEGVGVSPDVEVPVYRALDVAHRMLLLRLAEQSGDARNADWLLPVLDARLTPPAEPEAIMRRAAGRYEGRELQLEDGALVYRWHGRFNLRLVPLSDTLFAVEGTDEYRFRLLTEDGRVTGLERIFRDGTITRYPKL